MKSINASSIVYTQSKSNKNISSKDNQKKRFTPFFSLNSRQKEKLNISKFFKSKKNYYNNINLIIEQNNQKKIAKKEDLNISIPSKSCKKNNYKTLNCEQTSYGRIMKYFTVKSHNKPMNFDEISQVFVPIRNTLSNEHRNKKDENVKDKINCYLLNSKDKIIQIFKKNKLQKKNNTKNSNLNNKKEQNNKSQSKILNKEEARNENDINYNNLKTIDNNNEENNHKNILKNSYQYRIRKINVPSGINLASIQSNNKLLHNLLNKKPKKTYKNNNDRIQTDININKNLK